MNELENVTVEKAANIYFEGKVTSRTLHLKDGSRKTLGFVLPGTYEFVTESAEYMEISSGKGTIKLKESTISFEKDSVFTIPENTVFSFIATKATDYCCTYLTKK